jgi:hypothetical protein
VSDTARFRFAGFRSAIDATRNADSGRSSTPFAGAGSIATAAAAAPSERKALRDQPAERMPDDDRLLIQLGDLARVVRDHLGKPAARNAIGGSTRLGDRGAVTRPADRACRVARLAERIDPRVPRVGVQPEAVNEDDGSAALIHRKGSCHTLRED